MFSADAWRSVEAATLSGGAILVALLAYGIFIALNGIDPFAVSQSWLEPDCQRGQ